MKPAILSYEFVDAIPATPQNGVLYVALEYAVAVHNCCCGCGHEVVTPISPTDWKITYDGVSISLSPSIGNWGFECRSHYWIVNNMVRWANDWSPADIQAGRRADGHAKSRYYGPGTKSDDSALGDRRPGIWNGIGRWFSRLFRSNGH